VIERWFTGPTKICQALLFEDEDTLVSEKDVLGHAKTRNGGAISLDSQRQHCHRTRSDRPPAEFEAIENVALHARYHRFSPDSRFLVPAGKIDNSNLSRNVHVCVVLYKHNVPQENRRVGEKQ
jgi:hypothetical protein